MNNLPENLINKIMLYVSHPCADMLRNCPCERFDEVIVLRTQRTFIPNSNVHTMGFFSIKDNTTEEEEFSYEFDVIRNHVYNKLQVCAISEEDILRLCPEYLHFNEFLLHGLLNEDAERLEQKRIENDDDYDRADSESEQSDYSETEHMRHLFITD